MIALSGRKDGEPITAADILRAEAILRDPSHPDYPQWAKDWDAQVHAIQNDILAQVIVRVCAVESP